MSIIPLISGTASSLNFSVLLSRTGVQGSSYDFGTIETSLGVTATPLNAPGPVTYEWILVSGDASIIPNSPFSATTYFSTYFPSSPASGVRNALYRCDVTSGMTTVSSENVEALLERFAAEV